MSERSSLSGSEVAVIGMACRLPGARSAAEFWQNLRLGRESLSRLLDEELHEAGVDAAVRDDPRYVRSVPLLEGVELFDAAFFGYTPLEAKLMDPQQRLFLECAWEAFEDAGYDPAAYAEPVGVFTGAKTNTYLFGIVADRELLGSLDTFQIALGNDLACMATRVSYKLDLRGPSYALHTACSTSLVTVHLACQSLLLGECRMALAGGAAVNVPQRKGYLFQPGGMLSPDGSCRTFDERAQGSNFGNGVGAVLLKRLEDAVADGDHVYAVIRGSATNNDGAQKASYTAPGVAGQTAVLLEAMACAGVDAESLSYVEAHGTATDLGDCIEMQALSDAFRATTPRRGFCAIGSVKTNIGHLETAAGVAGLIKTALALHHREIPPSLHFTRANPKLDLPASPFYVATELAPWRSAGAPRRAGVSSFGIGSTNAHVILEEAPATPAAAARPAGRPAQLLLLSARSAAALDAATSNLASHLQRCPELDLGDVAFTLSAGRRAFPHRRAVVCRQTAEAARLLAAPDATPVATAFAESGERPVAFLFPGLGEQAADMGLGLYRSAAVFRREIDACAEILASILGLDLREVLYPHGERGGAAASSEGAGSGVDLRRMLGRGPDAAAADPLATTRVSQPALFAVEYALARLWMSWGIQPRALLGYSLGEYVAACVASVLTLPDALRLVAERARLIGELPAGAMAAVPLSPEEAAPLLADLGLSLAAVNGPALCVAAGPAAAVEALERTLAERGLASRRLATDRAFHSAMMEPAAGRLAELLRGVPLAPPRIPYLSNVTGTWITAEEATDPGYWVRHLCGTVRFADGAAELLRGPERILLEVGPGLALTSAVKQHPACGDAAARLAWPSLPGPYSREDALESVLGAAGRLWLAGTAPDWRAFWAGEERRRVPLPTYPFERQRHWIGLGIGQGIEPPRGLAAEAAGGSGEPAGSVPAGARRGRRVTLDKQADMADWFYAPVWRRAPADGPETAAVPGAEGAPPEASPWLLFVDRSGLGDALAERLRARGRRVVVVRAGEVPARLGKAEWTIRPGCVEDYESLLAALAAGGAGGVGGMTPKAAVHLWGADAEPGEPAGEADCERLQQLGFHSLLCLAQALGRQRGGGALAIAVVTSQVHRVTGREALCPEKATVLGPCRVIPQEFPHLTCRQIDIEPPAAPARLAEGLLAELERGAAEAAGAEPIAPVMALRGTGLEERWVQDFAPLPLVPPPPQESAPLPVASQPLAPPVPQSSPAGPAPAAAGAEVPRLRRGGVYLLTGGLGGVGLTVAEHLGRTLQAKLVLTGRSPFPPRDGWERWLAEHGDADAVSGKIRRLMALEAAGAEVLAAGADAADEAAMREVVAAARRRFGAIHGVIHLAGVPGGGIIQLKTPAAAARILAPKVRGARVLDAVFRGEALDFLLLFSSIASVLGEFGQADYCGANAFLDAFAQRNAARGGPRTVAVDWDIWREVGLAVTTEVPAQLRAWREEMLEQAILPAEGVLALERVLAAATPPQVVVSAQPLPGRIELGRSFTGEGFLRELAATAQAGGPAGSSPGAAAAPPSRRVLGTGFAAAQGTLESRLAALWQHVLGVEQLGVNDNFFDLGGNSLLGLQLVAEINRELGTEIAPVTLFEAPTVSALARQLAPRPAAPAGAAGAAGSPGSENAAGAGAGPAEAGLSSGPAARPAGAAPAAARTDIAIIGMTGRFPGAPNLDALWRVLRDGVEAVTFFTDEELLASGVEPEVLADPRYVRAGSVLDDVERFDAALFGYSPREAEVMDPQHRFFLECAWEVLEQAGYDPGAYPGAIGVYAGSNLSTYLLQLYADPEVRRSVNLLQAVLGNDKDSLTTSVSYKLNLRGPSVAVQTFCSTSLVAVHMACQSLRQGECDMALAGGVRIVVPARQGYLYEVGGLAPDDGHTRSFDAGANGSVLGHGVAVVLLKRLADALADGDPVRAVIKGSAINNDGSQKAGYTAPSIGGQAAAVEAALAAAGVPAESIGYLEAHGSATELGDPIEIAALTRAFRAHTERRGFCRIGSLKSNFGHLDRAAGAAGLIKAVLALEQEQIPPTINYQRPNPKIDFETSPFVVNDRLTPWPRSPRSPGGAGGPLGPLGAAPRRAAVNSLGMGGTNVHLILEEAPAAEPSGASRSSQPSRPWQLLPLTARTATALDAVTRNLGEHLARHPGLPLADAAYTLQVGRKPLAHRRFAVCRDGAEAAGLLSGGDPRRLLGGWCDGRERPVVFLFAGLGGQYVDMGRGLYDTEPAFRAEIDRCAELLLPELGLDLRQVLYPPSPVREEDGAGGAAGVAGAAGVVGVTGARGANGTPGAPGAPALPGVMREAGAGAPVTGSGVGAAGHVGSGIDLRRMLGRSPAAPASPAAAGPLDQTRIVQPALFVVEYALARLWMSWGVIPEAMAGYSIGEYVAACLAGVLTLPDALRLVAERARLIDELPAGAMLAAGLGEADLVPLLGPELSLAAVNGPEQSVAAGPEAAVAALDEELARRGVASRRLQARHAFHSRMMEPLFGRLVALTAGVERRAPAIPYLSNVTGGWITAEEAADPTYWARHACGTVRFSEAVAALAQVPDRALLEIGPGQTLASLVLQHPAAPGRAGGGEPAVAASLPHSYERQADLACLLTALGKLWTLGVPIDWQRFHAGGPGEPGNPGNPGNYRRRVNLPTYPFERERYWIDTRAPAAPATAAAAAAGAGAGAAGGGGAPGSARPLSEGGATAGIGGIGGGGAVGFYPRPSLRVEYAEPQGEVEQAIAEAWRQLLGVAQVGRYDSFLDLGGDSLLASRMVTRLREVVRVEIPIRQVFESPTVADLAGAVEQLRRQAEEREVEALLAQIRGLSDEDLELEILRRESGPVQEEAR